MSGSISGTVLQDLTGNGFSPDDPALGGAIVKLYRDVNGNGVLDAGDGPAIAVQGTAAGGSFRFANLASGRYLVADAPVGAVRTGPAVTNFYAVNVNVSGNFGGYRFDNYRQVFRPSLVSGVSYLIDNSHTVNTLAGNVHEGDTVQARFTIAAGVRVKLSLASYLAPGPTFDPATASQQMLYDAETQTFGLGAHSLSVRVHDCDFQVDFVGGPVIDRFGPPGSNIFYSQQGRLISSAFGGTHSCIVPPQISPGPPPSSISGRIFCDQNLNGVFDSGVDMPLAGQTVRLGGVNVVGHVVSLTTTTQADGTYQFDGLLAGTYSITEPEPAGHVDAKQFAAAPAGNGNATQDAATGNDIISGIRLDADQQLSGYDFAEVGLSSLSGRVFADANDNGVFDFIDAPIPGVAITLTGTNDLGQSVGPLVGATDPSGQYAFADLRPGTYQLAEAQPPGFAQGKDHLGSQGGDASVQDVFSKIPLPGCGADAVDYDFAELGPALARGGTATIGFWHNKNGQALLLSLNGGPDATSLATWLAATFPNLYGPTSPPGSGALDFTGKSNAWVAAFYLNNDFSAHGQKLDAQVLGAAFAVYVTDATLAGAASAARYGFNVSSTGTGFQTINVGLDGAAFGVADNSTITVFQALQFANERAANDVLYNGDAALRNLANDLFDAINQGGDIG